MRYKIIGKDTRYGGKECYGVFDSLKDATFYMNTLKTGTLGTIIKFQIIQIEG